MDKAYLILEDGSVFEGESIGAQGESIGQVVFTTSMGGFTETICDDRFYGQMVVQTFPIVGSYGFVPAVGENLKPALKGYIVRELTDEASNFRMEGSLNEFLKKNSVVGIEGVDTRALTRKLRDVGTMNGMISPDIKNMAGKLERIKAYKIGYPICENSSEEILVKKGNPTVAVWDLGYADSVVRQLLKREINVVRFKGIGSVSEILKGDFDGVIISDGGGNHKANKELIFAAQKLVESCKNLLGIGQGHLLMAETNGLTTKYLKCGHHGSNHPVKALKGGVSFLAGHNHSYTVVAAKAKSDIFETIFVSLNDNSCEGILYKNKNHSSVQFGIDSKGGSQVLDEFISVL